MPIAVTITFDEALDEKLRASTRDIHASFGGLDLLGHEVTPHATLAIFRELNLDAALPVLRELAAFSPLRMQLSSAGTFPGKEGVAFVAPVVTSRLLELHTRVHTALAPHGSGPYAYYERGVWVPHVTVGHGIDLARVGESIAHARLTLPLSGHATGFWVLDAHVVDNTAVQSLAEIPFAAPEL